MIDFRSYPLLSRATYQSCKLVSDQLVGGISEKLPAIFLYAALLVQNFFRITKIYLNTSLSCQNTPTCVAFVSLPRFFRKQYFTANLDVLLVSADYRGLGYGTNLLTFLIEEVVRCYPSCNHISVQTLNSTDNRAIQFYIRNGFVSRHTGHPSKAFYLKSLSA